MNARSHSDIRHMRNIRYVIWCNHTYYWRYNQECSCTLSVCFFSFLHSGIRPRQDLHIFLAHHESEAVKVHAAAFHSQIKNDADPSGTPMERPQRKLKAQTKSMRSRSMSGESMGSWQIGKKLFWMRNNLGRAGVWGFVLILTNWG